MTIRPRSAVLIALALATSAIAASRPVEPRTAAAVLAVDDAWGAAEARGDADFVDRLLMPDYRSVGPTGTATPKAAIVEGARSRSGSPMAAATIAEWKAAHPLRGDVALYGDTAVLTWISTKPAAGEPISSCDIFVYRDGHWHAIYSQHSAASV